MRKPLAKEEIMKIKTGLTPVGLDAIVLPVFPFYVFRSLFPFAISKMSSFSNNPHSVPKEFPS
jgi:hypothetical protein